MTPEIHGRAITTREWRVVLATIVAVALLITLIDASRFYLGNTVSGYELSWKEALTFNAPSWWILAGLAPGAVFLAQRFPLGRHRGGAALTVHAFAAMLFATLHFTMLAAYYAIQRSEWNALPVLFRKFSGSFVIDMLTYAAIIGIWHAVQYHREARARERAALQLERSLTEARLAVLRGQLNPHFLFNTLNAISTMALKREHENVVRTLGYLGELLRVSLDDQLPQEVSLSEELEFLDRYLEIQRARLGDRLTIVHEIDADVLDAMVPSMLLQPLVENAIAHGIAIIPGPGEVRIVGRKDGDMLSIDVIDTGPGVSGDSSQPEQVKRSNGSGIGLSNTRARLAQLYGTSQDVVLTSNGSSGARVSVRIPFHTAPVLQTSEVA